LLGAVGWEVREVQGKPRIKRLGGSNLDLPFHFSFLKKIPNLGHMFNTTSNLPTFFNLKINKIIHLINFIQLLDERKISCI
jgi:hypothetical protein